MRLGVNVVRLTRPFTGVGRYIESLLREWSRMEVPFEEVVLYVPAPLVQAAFPRDRFRIEVAGPRLPDPLWESWSLRRRSAEVDLLFGPSYTLPLAYRAAAAVSYFGPADPSPFPTREWWRGRMYERLYRVSARRARLVLTAAEHVKRRVVSAYGVPAARVQVIPLAASADFKPDGDPEERDAILHRHLAGTGPYLLFVGKMVRRHAIPNLIEAFARLKRTERPPHRLLLVGPDPLGIEPLRIALEHRVDDAVAHAPYVPYGDLPAVYRGAEAMVFPASDAEGFGLPVLEAMACGTPVVSTARGSIPEIAGQAALLVASSSVADIHEGLRRIVGDAALRRDLRERGIERASAFSWENTARRTMAALWSAAARIGSTMDAR